MISRTLFIFTIILCIINYPTTNNPHEQLAYILIASIAAAALMEPRGKAKE